MFRCSVRRATASRTMFKYGNPIGGLTSSPNHPDPLTAPTPPVEPTLAPTRPSRPAPLAIIQYYSGGNRLDTHALTCVSYSICRATHGRPEQPKQPVLRGSGKLKAMSIIPKKRCVYVLLAFQEEQHDLSRAHAAIVGEELPRGFKAVGDRGFAVR